MSLGEFALLLIGGALLLALSRGRKPRADRFGVKDRT